jgi:cysteine desulfurase
VVDLDHLESLVDDNTLLISCMYINNETGIIQPIDKIGEFCKENGILFHVDATQLFGKYEISIKEIFADFITASAHKFHGPKGSGILYRNKDIEFKCLIEGGSQEGGFRAGTENVPGIVGFGEALRIARNFMAKNFQHMLGLEKYFLHELEEHDVHYIINGDLSYKSPWIFNINFGIDADLLMDNMVDFCFSKSSACSKNFKPSHVLAAMSIDDEDVKCSVRVSFSKYTTKEEIDKFVIRIKELQTEKNK